MDLLEKAKQYRASNIDLTNSIQELEGLESNFNNYENNHMEEEEEVDDGRENYMENANNKFLMGINMEEEGGECPYDSASQEEIHLCENIDKMLQMEVDGVATLPTTEELKNAIETLLLEKKLRSVEDELVECKNREISLSLRETQYELDMRASHSTIDQSIMIRMDLECAITDIKINKLRQLSPDVLKRMMKPLRAHAVVQDLSNSGGEIYHSPYGLFSILVMGDYHMIQLTSTLV